jgi:hypothetical protein
MIGGWVPCDSANQSLPLALPCFKGGGEGYGRVGRFYAAFFRSGESLARSALSMVINASREAAPACSSR